MIDLSLKLFPWAQRQQDKAAVKLHVGLNHGGMIPEFVALGDGKEHDLVQGRKFDFPKGSLVALDKGYVDYGQYESLTDMGVFVSLACGPTRFTGLSSANTCRETVA